MKGQIEEIRYLNYRGIRFSNSAYEAVVLPERGANLIRLHHSGKNVSILREPENKTDLEEKEYEYGIPVLFFPNRIEDGRFVFEGRDYRFPVNEPKSRCHLHGFLHDKEWRVEKTNILEDGSPCLTLSYTWGAVEEELRIFPHPSEFTLTFELSEKGMRQTVSIENRGKDRMPAGFGYHTSFSVPRGGRYRINLSLGQKWEMNDRHFPTGSLTEASGNGEITLDSGIGRIFGHYTLREKLLESGPLYGAVVWNTAENYQVYYYFERPFKNLVIWNKTGEDGFICIEPQTCAVNAFNIDKPDSITGRFALDGGAVFRAATTMGLVELDAKNRPGEVK